MNKIFRRRSRPISRGIRLTDGLRVYEIVKQLYMQNYGLLGGSLYVRLVRVISGGVDPKITEKHCPNGLCDRKMVVATDNCFRMGDRALSICTVIDADS